MKANLFLVAALGTLLFSSCAKKAAPPSSTSTVTHADSYTINGSGFTNANYFISGNPTSASSDLTGDSTKMHIAGYFGDTCLIQLDIQFIGKAAGTYQLTNNPSPGANSMQVTTIEAAKNDQTIYTSQSGATLTITNYPGVGGQVTGTFKGNFQSAVGNNYTIANGTFSATRNS